MRVHVDMSKCQAYGICAEEAPRLFQLDEWGYAQVGDAEVPSADEPATKRAVAGCPATAITLSE